MHAILDRYYYVGLFLLFGEIAFAQCERNSKLPSPMKPKVKIRNSLWHRFAVDGGKRKKKMKLLRYIGNSELTSTNWHAQAHCIAQCHMQLVFYFSFDFDSTSLDGVKPNPMLIELVRAYVKIRDLFILHWTIEGQSISMHTKRRKSKFFNVAIEMGRILEKRTCVNSLLYPLW